MKPEIWKFFSQAVPWHTRVPWARVPAVLICAAVAQVQVGMVHAADTDSRLSSSAMAPGWLQGGQWYAPEDSELSLGQSPGRNQGAGLTDPGDQDSQKDWEGLKRDTYYFLSYQFIAIGLLYIAPTSVSNWTKEDKENADFGKWWDNVSDPQWDSDDWWINYVLHPYWGASYYVRAQMRGYNATQSFWYSFLLSSAYEYGVEAIFEEPSIQDLIVTPGLGSVLGSVFMDIRYGIEAKRLQRGRLTGWDRFVLVATDPLGALNNGVDRLLGRDVEVSIVPYHKRQQVSGDAWQQANAYAGPAVDEYGLQFSLRW